MNTMQVTKTSTTRVNLPAKSRTQLIEVLNQQLADTFDLYGQTKQAHWNMKGPLFYSVHDLTDRLAAELEELADLIAERATTLGGVAEGTVRLAAANSRLTEFPPRLTTGREMVEALAENYAALSTSTREALEEAECLADPVTADLFTEVARKLEKSLWLLDSHLQ